MAKIVKKILPESFDLIASGKKKFEFRLADFDLVEGDTLVLEEWDSSDPETRKPTGRTIEKQISYMKRVSIDDTNSIEDAIKHGFYLIQFN